MYSFHKIVDRNDHENENDEGSGSEDRKVVPREAGETRKVVGIVDRKVVDVAYCRRGQRRGREG